MQGHKVAPGGRGVISHQFRPLGFTIPTTVWFLARLAGVPQWLQGFLGSSTACLDPGARDQCRQQWWAEWVEWVCICSVAGLQLQIRIVVRDKAGSRGPGQLWASLQLWGSWLSA